MKRPSTASAGFQYLNQGYPITVSVQAVGAFLRYCERNKPGFELTVIYENDMAILKPVQETVQATGLNTTLVAGLKKVGLKLTQDFYNPGLSSVN